MAPGNTGGMIFTAPDVALRDQYGNAVMCTRCGGVLWHVTVGGGKPDKIECATADCEGGP